MTLISIIIPSFNNGDLLEATLRSVELQTSSDWECIIVDDGSTDNTEAIVREVKNKNSKFRFYKRPEYRLKGANACRNIGMEKAKGDYLIFLDGDDLISSDCIESRINMIDSENNLFIFPMRVFTDSIADLGYLVNVRKKSDESYLDMFLSYRSPWPITSMLVKHDHFNVKFNEKLQRFQDVDFSIKLLLQKDIKIKDFTDVTADCFYRKDHQNIDKFSNPEFIDKMLKSFLILIKDLVNLLKESSLSNKIELLYHFHHKIFVTYIQFKNGLTSSRDIQILRLLFKYHVINIKDYLKYFILSKKSSGPIVNIYLSIKKQLT
ncbi:glycosyltransferase family 2 protein [Nonlabens sp.]|uniref:glycosyltransferase family 2 protein n=1 Tax=Nonlabens sp. TaxID=1888209 RepID=UPI003F69B0AF